MKKKLLGYYDYTVILTYCGVLFSFCGILRVLCQDYWWAALCLMMAGVCDMFDGTVAATKKRTAHEKKFGIQIDSLSDLVGFGVLPAVFVYMAAEQKTSVGVVCVLFVLCALIRLAYFNVLEEERQEKTDKKRDSYLGVPVTTIAVLLPAVYLLYDYRICQRAIWYPLLLTGVGIGYLLPVEVKKPGFMGKVCIVLLGMLEMIGMVLFLGWDIV